MLQPKCFGMGLSAFAHTLTSVAFPTIHLSLYRHTLVTSLSCRVRNFAVSKSNPLIYINLYMCKHFIKTLVPAAVFGLAVGSMFTACSDDNDVTTPDYVWGNEDGLKTCNNLLFEGNVIGNGDNEFVFKGTQTIKRGTYTLKGWVYVGAGSTLTIEPGTIIKGDKATMAALIVEPGAKLIAQGTPELPIVFTSAQPAGSRKPGDWGGLIICGKAPNNQTTMQIEGGPRTKHGGTDVHDNSGVLSYVRIEFAGYPFQTDKEINGLTLGSVGDATQIDHVQVSYSNDDSFEWFGGTVNCSHLICYNGWDDDFDTDNGFGGTVQYGLVVRNGKLADKSQSNSFESDNCADGADVAPYTTALFSNITFIGPKATDATFQNTTDYINGGGYNPNNGSALGRFQAAMQIRRGSRLNCINSVAVGYPIGIMLDGEKGNTQQQAQQGNIKLQNIWFADMDILGSDANKLYEDVLVTGYDADQEPVKDATQSSFSSTFFLAQSGNVNTTSAQLQLTGNALAGFNFMPSAGSPLLTAGSFTGISSSFLTPGTYVGAFNATDNWTAGWANFDPQNTAY